MNGLGTDTELVEVIREALDTMFGLTKDENLIELGVLE